jgi:hypothetical protein
MRFFCSIPLAAATFFATPATSSSFALCGQHDMIIANDTGAEKQKAR